MKKVLIVLSLLSICFLGCDEESMTGNVFDDHEGVVFDDGSGLTDVMDGKEIYFGNLHSHTQYSDGEGTPEEAFSWARDTAQFDFYAVTDHAEQLNSSEWTDAGVQADIFNEDHIFVALRGFEWSHSTGHVNVLATDTYTTATASPSLDTLGLWLTRNGGYAQFNHPGREANMFDNFGYNSLVTENVIGIETGNKSSGNINGEYLQHYSQALGKGWRLAPTNNLDNHSLRANSHRTAIIADDLTRADVLNGLGARRVYSTDDPNMRVVFKIGAHWMGEVVNIEQGDYAIIVVVDDDEPITLLELIDSSGMTIESSVASSDYVEWNPSITVENDNYYFLKVTQNDVNDDESSYNSQIAVTAPIWLNVQ